MQSEAEQSRKLTCPGCGGRFRITPKQGGRLPPAVPCPTCETRIPVERSSNDQFWVSRSYAEIFHRNPAMAAPAAEGSDEESSGKENPRGVHRTSRTFRDVREVRREREGLLGEESTEASTSRPDGTEPPELPGPDETEGPEEAAEPEHADSSPDTEAPDGETATPESGELLEEVDRDPPGADLDELEEEFSFIAAEAAEDVAGTPLPLPVEQPSQPQVDLPDEESDGPPEIPESEREDASPETADERGAASSEAPARTPEAEDPAEPTADETSGPGTTGESGGAADRQEPVPAEEIFESSEVEEVSPESAEVDRETDFEAGDRRGGRVTWLPVLLAGFTGLAVATAGFYFFGSAGSVSADADSAGAGAVSVGGDAGTPEADASTEVEPDVSAGPTGDTIAAAVGEARKSVASALQRPRHARRMLEAEHFAQARRLTIREMIEEGQTRQLQKLFDQSIERDADLTGDPVDIAEDVDIGAIEALGGGWSISFKLTRNGQEQFAFKPSQRHWEEGWRAEVASYRLCKIVVCHFRIPRNRPARISKEEFETLYNRVENEDQAAYKRRFDDLKWRKEIGPDGVERQYLYGTLKDWVPQFAKWPIEYEDVWRPWLDAGADRALLEKPFDEALAPYKELGEEDFYQSLVDERDGVTTRSVARQLSTILTFDFLVSNWDRYSTAESYYGVNNQFADGRFVSIDNGAAFPAHHFRVVSRRLQPVTRFSRSTVASIRALRPQITNPVLFPDPSVKEQSRLDVFWQQRDRFLDRINGLVAEYGRDSVLFFR